MAESIEWKITEQTVAQKLTSSDNRWHISKTQSGDADAEFFLTNCDLLLSPHGTGKDYRECFESFIADCDAYINKLKAVRSEAESHMQEMIDIEKELAHAD